MPIYYLCPDNNHPTGGVRVIYRHVDILNQNGFEAYVLHQTRGFRCTWFFNDTKIAYTKFPLKSFKSRLRSKIYQHIKSENITDIPISEGVEPAINDKDLLVIPENKGPDLASIGRGIPKVILNQNGFLTFKGYSFDKNRLITPYHDKSVKAVLVNSEHCEGYVRYAFPQANVYPFILSIDPSQFYFQSQKKKQICFSRIKSETDAMQVMNILKFRGTLADFEIVPFINISQGKIAELMRESLIFLSFGYREGFGLPAAEAMACGCIVIGYHGWGGKEFFSPDFSFPIEDGDIIGFAQQVEHVIQRYNEDENYFFEQRRQASEYILNHYSPDKEEQVLMDAWRKILCY